MERRVRAYRLSDEHRGEHGSWLVERLAPGILSVFLNQRLPSDRARDLTQETLSRVVEKIEEYRFEAPFGAWVRQITVNRLRNEWRDTATRRRYEDSLEETGEVGARDGDRREHPALRRDPEAESSALRADLRRALSAALRELPPRMRRCLQLYTHDFTYQEIADMLGIELNTVRSQISHGYRRLRPLMADYRSSAVTERSADLRKGPDGS